MQSLIICALILTFISPCICIGFNVTMDAFYNVMDFGAKGDGKTDDSQVCVLSFSFHYSYFLIFLF